MPIKFISLNKEFIDKMYINKYNSYCMKIEDYIPIRKTYYVSPANSLGFMDGGIDLSLSRIVFPNIEKEVKKSIQKYGKLNKIHQKYLPIGSSIIINNSENNNSLIVAPTMLLPHDVSNTQNAYYSTIAILYNILINHNQNIDDVDILFTSMCCGYGKMNTDESIKQILNGIQDYKIYNPNIINNNVIINEPNLNDQPTFYENISWINIMPNMIRKQ